MIFIWKKKVFLYNPILLLFYSGRGKTFYPHNKWPILKDGKSNFVAIKNEGMDWLSGNIALNSRCFFYILSFQNLILGKRELKWLFLITQCSFQVQHRAIPATNIAMTSTTTTMTRIRTRDLWCQPKHRHQNPKKRNNLQCQDLTDAAWNRM